LSNVTTFLVNHPVGARRKQSALTPPAVYAEWKKLVNWIAVDQGVACFFFAIARGKENVYDPVFLTWVDKPRQGLFLVK
jgi:hypothetical protein